MFEWSEDAIEKQLNRCVEAFGGIAFKFRPFGIIGIPDRIVLLPFGRLVFVELKKPKKQGGKVKPWQERMHAKLRALGFRCEVIWSYDQVAGSVEHWALD